MNRTWILKLYPEPWRARYEPEFRELLQEAPMGVMDLLDIAFGAIDAHLRPQIALSAGGGTPPSRPAPAPHEDARGRERMVKALLIHAGLFLFLTAMLVTINLLTSRDFLWSGITTWALAMPLALHTMIVYPWRKLFGALAVPLAVANIGLIGINIFLAPDYPWSIWTLSVSAIPVIGTGLVAFGITSMQRSLAITGGLVAALLFVASIYERSFIGTALFDIGLVISLLFAIDRLRTGRWSLLLAHAFLFVSANAMLFILNLAQEQDVLWFQYVLAATSLPLAVHALVRYGMLEFTDATWEQAKIAQLTARIRESAVTDEVQRKIFLTARIQRTFWSHLFLAVVVALDLAIINVMSGTDTPWLLWPVGVSVILLGIHAGYAFGPNRWLCAHLMFWLGTAAGLIAIDIWEASDRWWVWPVAAYGMIALAHVGWIFLRPRWYGALLGFVAAGIVFVILADRMTSGATWWYWPALAGIGVVALATPFAFNLLQRIMHWESRRIAPADRD